MKYLFIGAHLDDIEISCGGTIAKFLQHDVYYLGLSPCHNPIRLEIECTNATKKLGIPRQNVKMFAFPVRSFYDHRQEVADTIRQMINLYDPDVIFTHSVLDRHPDHRCVAEETIRVFNGSIISYLAPWNGQTVENYFIKLDSLDKKLAAIACYQSQSERKYCDPEFIESWAVATGAKCGFGLAEGFEVVRLIH